jgi:hypothetical protein
VGQGLQAGHAQRGRQRRIGQQAEGAGLQGVASRIAVASSKAMWVVGLPRRRASSSIAGRSSCTSE